jgi:hypothetical protein
VLLLFRRRECAGPGLATSLKIERLTRLLRGTSTRDTVRRVQARQHDRAGARRARKSVGEVPARGGVASGAGVHACGGSPHRRRCRPARCSRLQSGLGTGPMPSRCTGASCKQPRLGRQRLLRSFAFLALEQSGTDAAALLRGHVTGDWESSAAAAGRKTSCQLPAICASYPHACFRTTLGFGLAPRPTAALRCYSLPSEY